MVLGRLASTTPAGLSESELGSIENLINDIKLPPERRWPLFFGLARAVDARGDFDLRGEPDLFGQRPSACTILGTWNRTMILMHTGCLSTD